MGQTDIAYSNIPRVRSFWSKRKRTAGESLGNPNPQKPKHKSMSSAAYEERANKTAFDFPIVGTINISGWCDGIGSTLGKPLGPHPSWWRHTSCWGPLEMKTQILPTHALKHTFACTRSYVLRATEPPGLVSCKTIWYGKSERPTGWSAAAWYAAPLSPRYSTFLCLLSVVVYNKPRSEGIQS